MIDLTDQNFKAEVIESDLPVLVDFFAPWCGPCKVAGPVIDDLAEEYKGKIKVGKVNVDNASQITQKYGIMSVPTVAIFKSGEEIKRQVGFPGKEAYKKLIDSVLNPTN